MAKTNPSLTSITPASAGERNFVNIHRDRTDEPLNKDLANNGKNGMNDASSKVKTFPRKKFHFGNDMADSIAGYDPKESMSGTELARKHHFGRRLNKKHMFVNGKEKKTLKEATRKDQLAGIEKYYTDRMNDKMDKQANFDADPNDPDYRGEISFHNAMRAWAARQRIASPYNIHGDETRGHAKRIAQFSKEMIKRAKEKNNDNLYARHESLVEHLPANASVKDYIDDFQKSDNPRFKGKSAEERRKMAIGAWYGRNESLNEASKDKLLKYLRKTEPYTHGEDTHIKGRNLAKDKLGYGTNRAKVMASEGEVIYLSKTPKYTNKVPASKRFQLHQSNAGNEKVRKQAERLGYIKDKYPKAVSEQVSLVKSIVLEKNEWLKSLGDRVSDPKHDKLEVEKSIQRHKEKEKKKK